MVRGRRGDRQQVGHGFMGDTALDRYWRVFLEMIRDSELPGEVGEVGEVR